MSNTRDEFLETMRQNPDDLQTPLVFADWLEENGEAELAEFIRLQIKCEKLPRDDNSPEALTLRQNHHKTQLERGDRLKTRLLGEILQYGASCTFRRGFLVSIEWPVQWFLQCAKELMDSSPLLNKVTLGRVNGWGERLAKCPQLARCEELEIQAWISPADAVAVANCPYLRQLRSLEIWLGNTYGGDAEVLKAFATGAKSAYPNLQELRIVDNPGCRAETIAEANHLAGRDVAVPVLPAPRLFPISAKIYGALFAGQLGDGSQVLVDTTYDDSPRIFLFDQDGHQQDVQSIEIGPDQSALLYLEQQLGFTFGDIRIAELIDDSDLELRLSDYTPDAYDHIGKPDNPDDEPNQCEEPMGAANRCAYWLKYGAFVFYYGNKDLWVGPHGYVEST